MSNSFLATSVETLFLRDLLLLFCEFLLVAVTLLLSVAVLTLVDRKIMAAAQRRTGPNVVGIFGILQPIADGLKLFTKEPVLLTNSNKILFLVGPIISFFISLIMWGMIPFPYPTSISFIFDSSLSLLFLLGLSSLGVYGVILSGWASNSFYAFLGALRASAQMISYEVSFGLCVLPVVVICQSFDLRQIVFCQANGCWNIFLVFPAAIIFFISILAETNRTPFDLPEAEGELVAGFNVEYSAFFFALFFLSEYANIILMSTLFVILFLGGWGPIGVFSNFFFALKIVIVLFVFSWVRAVLPRYRYDQLIQLGWKVILPFSLGYFLFVSGTAFFISQLL